MSLEECFWWGVPKRSEGRERIWGNQKYPAPRCARGVSPDKQTQRVPPIKTLRMPESLFFTDAVQSIIGTQEELAIADGRRPAKVSASAERVTS